MLPGVTTVAPECGSMKSAVTLELPCSALLIQASFPAFTRLISSIASTASCFNATKYLLYVSPGPPTCLL